MITVEEKNALICHFNKCRQNPYVYINSIGSCVRNLPDLLPFKTTIIYHLNSHKIQLCFKVAIVFLLGKFHNWPGCLGEDVVSFSLT